jgi:uncharacterized protein (DUF2249 family)
MEVRIMSQAAPPAQAEPATPVLATYPFDARAIAKRFRHAAIFGALEALGPGEAMRFVNDHNPLPLLRQMSEHFGETVVVEYRENCEAGVVIDFIKVA